LGEIEADAAKIEGIKICACTYQKEKDKIILHYVGDLSEKELTGVLKDVLPRYMLPARLHRMEEMCFTANGKVDRKALEKM
ncbi:MAG: AMP-dependent synthetase, partial [Lachnospiraceae bacterium]|nr:AMP-dependent synthetase [Lachnospiraceae bacterium]